MQNDNVENENTTNFKPCNLQGDWSSFYSESEFEIDFDLPFKGIGWYITKYDTLLVLPSGISDRTYRVIVWNSQNARESIQEIMNLSVLT